MRAFRILLPAASLAALSLATGCADRTVGMYDETYDQIAWGQGVDPPGDDDDNPRRDPYDHGYDRSDYRQGTPRTAYRQDYRSGTVSAQEPIQPVGAADYDGRPMYRDSRQYQQAGDIRLGGEMGSDPELRSPYSGDRYEDMGLYGNQPRTNE